MKFHSSLLNGIALGLALTIPARAQVTITSFDDFTSDALYGSWTSATIVSGPTAYIITASGYGSNWKYRPVNGAGYTNVQLSVVLTADAAADGKLGPIVTLEDADGTSFNYAWYGRPLGSNFLTMPLKTPTWVSAPGATPGLDLATLTHLHMQLDPSSFGGQYTVSWEDLSLSGAALPMIMDRVYDRTTGQFTLTWSSTPGQIYSVLSTTNLANAFTPLQTDIPAFTDSTTATVTVPAGPVGFLRIQLQ